MTDFNYLRATVSELEGLALQFGLSTEVSPAEAASYHMAGYFAADPEVTEVTEGYRRLVLLGRLALHGFDQDTTPPDAVVEFAESQGLTEYAPARVVQEAYNSAIESFVKSCVNQYMLNSLFCEFAGRTQCVRVEPGALPHGLDRLVETLRAYTSEGGWSTQRGVLRLIEPRDPRLNSVIASYIAEGGRPYVGLVVKTGERSWGYVVLGADLAPLTAAELLHPPRPHGLVSFYNQAKSGFYRRITQLPLESFGLTPAPGGFEYSEEVSFYGQPTQARLDVDVILHTPLLHSLTTQPPESYGARYCPSPFTLAMPSLPEYLSKQTVINRLLRPNLLKMDKNLDYHGPEEYERDPVMSLVLAYAKENKRILLEDPSLKFYWDNPIPAMRAVMQDYLGATVSQLRSEYSTALQIGRCRDLAEQRAVSAGSTSEAPAAALVSSRLVSKSMVEVMAELED